MRTNKLKIFFISCALLVCTLLLCTPARSQDQPSTQPPAPIADPSINAFGSDLLAAKIKERKTAVKVFLRMKINREKMRLPWKQDKELLAKYQTILDSPELIDLAVEKGAEQFDSAESKAFSASGGATAKEIGDGVLLEKILAWLADGGLEKIFELIFKIIDMFAYMQQFQLHRFV